MLLMDKSTISTGPFSIAFCMFTREYIAYTVYIVYTLPLYLQHFYLLPIVCEKSMVQLY